MGAGKPDPKKGGETSRNILDRELLVGKKKKTALEKIVVKCNLSLLETF